MLINAKLIYFTLHWISMMFLVPIGYFAVMIRYRGWLRGQSQIWKLLFLRTNEWTVFLSVFSVIWFVAAVALGFYFVISRLYWDGKLADNIPEEDEVIVRIYEKVCKKLNIQPDSIQLNRNVVIDTPCILGWIHPQVILPERDYTEEELEVIFFHELSHFKHNDLRYKALIILVVIIHCFNPAVYYLFREINLWSEYMADVSALEASDSIHHAKSYFMHIVYLIPDGRKKQVDNIFVSTLSKSKKMIDRRVDFMKKYQKMKSASKIVTAALAAVFVFASATTAYASGMTVADLHNVVYQKTENFTNAVDETAVGRAVVAEDGMVEYHCKIDDLDREGLQVVSTPDQDIVAMAAGVHYSFDWQVEPNTRYVSGPFSLKTTHKMNVCTNVTPGNKVYYMGIMDHQGNAYYVRGTGALAHNFNIPESTSYRVFVQNDHTDGTVLHATGYFVYDNK